MSGETMDKRATTEPPVRPHEFVGRSDRWCEFPGCDRPDRNPIHRPAASAVTPAPRDTP